MWATDNKSDLAMGQNQWYHFGVGTPPMLPILVYISGDWDVHWGYRVLTHSHLEPCQTTGADKGGGGGGG